MCWYAVKENSVEVAESKIDVVCLALSIFNLWVSSSRNCPICVDPSQILSYPIDVDELVHYDHAEHWSLRLCLNQFPLRIKQPERAKRRLFPRSFGSGTSTSNTTSVATAAATTMTTTTSVATGAAPTTITHRYGFPHSAISPLTAYLTEPAVFCQVLGYLLLSHATTVACRTPVGKSYENRSGAEANLKHGVRPLTWVNFRASSGSSCVW